MKNNPLINESDKNIFKQPLKSYLGNNLNDYLIDSLANMLAIDYNNRLKKGPEIAKHANSCIIKLKAYLKHQILTEEDFSTVMSLFALAITEKKTLDEELLNEQEKDQDIILDGLIASSFGDLPLSEQNDIKQVLKPLLAGSNAKAILNFINSDPNLFRLVITSAYKEKKIQKEIVELAAINLTRVIAETRAINRKVNINKSLFSKIALSIGLLAVASLSGLVGGVLLPALLAPAAAISIKFAPTIGAKLGSTLSQNNKYIKKKQERINEIVSAISSPELEQSLMQGQYLSQKKVQKLEPETTIKPEITKNVKRLENTKSLAQKNIRQR